MVRHSRGVKSRVVLYTSLATLMTASVARAVPPQRAFPAATSPAADGALPSNGHVLVFGSNTVSLDDVGLALFVDDQPAPITTSLLGCCTVDVAPDAPVPAGAAVTLLVSASGTDSTFAFTGADAEVGAPAIGTPEIVQVVTATSLVPPMTPHDGPAWVITLDVPGVAGAGALATYDEGGALLTIEPTTGAVFERLLTGAAGDRTHACLTVEARSLSGATTRAAPVCTDLPALPHVPALGTGANGNADGGGCASSSSSSASPLAIAVLAVGLAFRRRRIGAASLACALVMSGCAGRDLDAGDGGSVCPDAIVDHTFAAASFDDRFFEQQARPEYGWRTVKGLIVDPQDPERRRVGFLDGDFFLLHDEWLYFRLMNGADACGAEEIAPYEGATFANVDAIKAWAHAQERLPPFLSWAGERLYAPDFYRLSRNTVPRVYVPFYLTRDVVNEPRAYAMRVAGPDVLDRETLAAIFDALDPLMPVGAPLYWKPALKRPAQSDFAKALVMANDPLGDRVRWQ